MWRTVLVRSCLLVSLVMNACAPAVPMTVCSDSEATEPLLCDRPVTLVTPPGYDGTQARPLLILLHGYGYSGQRLEQGFGLSQVAAQRGWLFAAPDGTQDETNLRFWNATDGCCNLFESSVDDSAYLAAVIRDAKRRFNVDSSRVYLVGHSNGGFMAYRMACEHADQLAAIVSIAGATWGDDHVCQPTSSVSVLQIHGDQDGIIKYEGGRFAAQLALYPSAPDTVAAWARHDACTGGLISGGSPIDLDGGIAGNETKVERFADCKQSAVELWTIQGGEHFPAFAASFRDRVAEFLLAHPKPLQQP